MELIAIAAVVLVLAILALRPLIAGHIAAEKIVKQQHFVAADSVLSDILDTASSSGQLTQALRLLDEVRQSQKDGKVRIGHVAWVLMKLDGSTNAPPPRY